MARSEYGFCFTHRVRVSDMDQQAVVFNARYLDYADLAAVEYWRALGLFEEGRIRTQAPEVHVAKATVEFRKPIALDERIDLCVKVVRIGRTSMTYSMEFHGLGAEDLRAVIELVYVHIEAAGGRPSPWPAAMITAIERHEGLSLTDS
ncbi:MAG: thioesterase family protein [Steroidobacteraceae bacterium]